MENCKNVLSYLYFEDGGGQKLFLTNNVMRMSRFLSKAFFDCSQNEIGTLGLPLVRRISRVFLKWSYTLIYASSQKCI